MMRMVRRLLSLGVCAMSCHAGGHLWLVDGTQFTGHPPFSTPGMESSAGAPGPWLDADFIADVEALTLQLDERGTLFPLQEEATPAAALEVVYAEARAIPAGTANMVDVEKKLGKPHVKWGVDIRSYRADPMWVYGNAFFPPRVVIEFEGRTFRRCFYDCGCF